MQKPQDIASTSSDLDETSVAQIADLIESNLNDVAGSAADFIEVTSHIESTHTDEID